MPAIPAQFRGTLYDLMTKTARQVFLDGEFWRSDLSVGGGPIIPPPAGGQPPGIWPGPGDPDFPGGGQPPQSPGHPAFPIWGPPGSNFPDKPGYPPVVGGGPIYPPNVPPDFQPPTTPPPGTTTPVPPPPGSPGWPVHPIAMPDYIIVQYPGYGPVYVTPPAQPEPT